MHICYTTLSGMGSWIDARFDAAAGFVKTLSTMLAVQQSLTVLTTLLHMLWLLLINFKGSNAADVSMCLCSICSVHICHVRFSELKP